MTLEEVLLVARAGAQQGCTEALFTLGEQMRRPCRSLWRAYCAVEASHETVSSLGKMLPTWYTKRRV